MFPGAFIQDIQSALVGPVQLAHEASHAKSKK